MKMYGLDILLVRILCLQMSHQMLITMAFFTVLWQCSLAAKSFDCNPHGIFTVELTAGSKDLIYSSPRGSPYSGEKNCYWNASCPVGFNVHINCPFVDIPESSGCSRDHIVILTEPGVDSKRYCGTDAFQATSNGTHLGVLLLAPPDTTGGSFVCQLSCLLNDWPEFTKINRYLTRNYQKRQLKLRDESY